MKALALTTILGLLLTATTALAFDFGPDGTIDTYFYADGIMPYFHDALVLNDGDDYVIEKVWTGWGEVFVVQNIDLENHKLFCTEWADANVDKYIEVDPGFFGSAHVDKTVVWDGLGQVFREAWLGDNIYSVIDAGVIYGDAMFVENIDYKGDLAVYQSVGLNRGATCDDPEMPEPLTPPVCGWCI